MSQHTPGPWRLVDRPSREGFSVNGPEYVICPDVCAINLEQRQANAQLITAAPELLAALKALVPFMEMAFAAEGDTFGVRHNDANDALFAAESAIADAEGRTK